ncbi:MAG: hypothetical protein ACRDV4_07195, partial [Acidimicrobiales bacterium]
MSDGRMRIALLLAGLRWRAGSSLAMLVVAVVGVGVAAFGPIYLHSADQTILDGTLAAAPQGNTGLTLQPASGEGNPSQLASASRRVPMPGGAKHWFGQPISTDEVGLTAFFEGQPFSATLLSRTGACAHLTVVAGVCARRPGTVMLSTRSAKEIGLGVGQPLSASFEGSLEPRSLLVVGLYDPGNPAAPYWWGQNFFAFGFGSSSKPQLDSVFASASTVRASAPARDLSYMLQVPFEPGSLSVDDASSFSGRMTAYQSYVLRAYGVDASTELLQILSQASDTEHTTATIVAVIDLQLVLLALFVLYFVSARTAAEREPDVRLAELRGFKRSSTLAVALSEPIAVIVGAIPLGLLVAWLVALALATPLFGAGIGAPVTLLALGAALATGVAGIVATTFGSRRIVAVAQAASAGSSDETARGVSTWRVAWEVAAVAVAVAAFVELSIAGVSGANGASHTDPLAALAPGLLALAAGIVGARLLPVALRSSFRATSGSRKVALALATRRVVRRREFAPQLVLLAIAVGLATFAISGWAVSARNR